MTFYHTVNNINIARILYLFFYNLLTRPFIAIAAMFAAHAYIIIIIIAPSNNIRSHENNVPSGHNRIYIFVFFSLDNNYQLSP